MTISICQTLTRGKQCLGGCAECVYARGKQCNHEYDAGAPPPHRANAPFVRSRSRLKIHLCDRAREIIIRSSWIFGGPEFKKLTKSSPSFNSIGPLAAENGVTSDFVTHERTHERTHVDRIIDYQRHCESDSGSAIRRNKETHVGRIIDFQSHSAQSTYNDIIHYKFL